MLAGVFMSLGCRIRGVLVFRVQESPWAFHLTVARAVANFLFHGIVWARINRSQIMKVKGIVGA